MNNFYNVLVIGAGISGIGAGHYLKKNCPNKSFAIIENRDSIGGTWDLFRYPGIRSDSDMHTLGFSFKPWREAKSIADGPSILKYVKETVEEHGLFDLIQFNSRLSKAEWDSATARWAIEVDSPDGASKIATCNFLMMCGGYYDYDNPHDPGFKNTDIFGGRIIHPQFWPSDFEHKGKKIVVIGSGATAMTLGPAMADSGAKVTMVQRSPTYVASRPDQDMVANFLRKIFPRYYLLIFLITLIALLISYLFFNLVDIYIALVAAVFAFTGYIIIPLTNFAKDRGWDSMFKWLHNLSVFNTLVIMIAAIIQIVRVTYL